MHMTWRHWWIVFVASLGQFIGTAVATVAGVIIPLLNILSRPELSSGLQGLIGAIDLVGIAVGSVIIGRLSDRYGYIWFFRGCPALVLAASLVSIYVPDVAVLVVCLFLVGFGIGGEYSLDSDYISELMPVSKKSLMIGIAKAASALGNIAAAAVCLAMLTRWHYAEVWPRLMWIVAVTAAVMILLRIRFWESPRWLLDHGRKAEAERVTQDFLGPGVEIVALASAEAQPAADTADDKSAEKPGVAVQGRQSFWSFVRHNGPRIMLSGVPWACEGLGVYGIGVFLPILVMALGLEHLPAHAGAMLHVSESVKVTLWISCIMLPGFVAGLALIGRGRYIPGIQRNGFWLCAVSLAVLLLAYHYDWPHWVSIIAFMCFELFLNMGPHLVTYVLPPKIYPASDRGLGTGVAAAIGKIGAVLGVFCIPVLLKAGGAVLVLAVSIAVMAVGALVTGWYGPRVMPRKPK